MIKRNDKLIAQAKEQMANDIPQDLLVHIAQQISKHC